jgi:hypothetical protein
VTPAASAIEAIDVLDGPTLRCCSTAAAAIRLRVRSISSARFVIRYGPGFSALRPCLGNLTELPIGGSGYTGVTASVTVPLHQPVQSKGGGGSRHDPEIPVGDRSGSSRSQSVEDGIVAGTVMRIYLLDRGEDVVAIEIADVSDGERLDEFSAVATSVRFDP